MGMDYFRSGKLGLLDLEVPESSQFEVFQNKMEDTWTRVWKV